MANSKRKYKSLKITQSAKGADCQVRIDNHCSFDPDKTIFAHKNGGGMGTKQPDLFGAYCCSDCHDIVDGKVLSSGHTHEEIEWMFYEGIFRTQQILLEKGLIKI